MARKIHWQAPATMLGSLAGGTALVIGHHVFYRSLAGQEAPSGRYSVGLFTYSKQEANIQLGTALAFLVKTALVVAVATAYIQLFWRVLLHQKTGQGTQLSHIDTAFSVIDNIFDLFYLQVWWRRPFLLLLATISWLMPIASIITPGTLSVQLSVVTPHPTRMANVPNLDFMSLSFAADMPAGSNAEYPDTLEYFYNGPSQAVKRIATAVAAEGAILPIKPPETNSSWDLSFNGPAMKCEGVGNDQYMSISRNIARLNFDSRWCHSPFGYLSWTNGSIPIPGNATILTPTSLTDKGLPATLYVVAVPAMWGLASTPGHFEPQTCMGADFMNTSPTNPLGDLGINSTMLECRVYNSSYQAKFNYTNGEQEISVQRTFNDMTAPLIVIEKVHGPNSFLPSNCSVLNRDGTPCFFDESVAKSLSYQAITDAFNQLVIGSVYQIITNSISSQGAKADTLVTTTSLLQSPELAFLLDRQQTPGQDSGTFFSLQQALEETDGQLARGLTNHIGITTGLPLQQALEDMFQNFTISLMSLKELRPNMTSPLAPPMTNITVPAYQNIYVYSAFKLWLAYGLAMFFSTCSVIVGLFALVSNGVSYSNKFSTILRTSRFAHIEPDAQEQDADGRDPLPKHLEKAFVVLAAPGNTSHPLKVFESAASKEPTVDSRLLDPSQDGTGQMTWTGSFWSPAPYSNGLYR